MWLLSLAVLITAWDLVIKHGRWPYGPWRSSLVAATIPYIVYHAIQDARSFKTQKQAHVPIPPRDLPGPRSHAGWNLFFGIVIAITVLLSAGFAGSIAGKKAFDGCPPSKPVSFDPSPSRIDPNRTYYLTIYNAGQYYLRENGTNKVVIVPENPGVVVTFSWPGKGHC